MFSLPMILGRLALAPLYKEKLISDRYKALPYKDQIYGFVLYTSSEFGMAIIW